MCHSRNHHPVKKHSNASTECLFPISVTSFCTKDSLLILTSEISLSYFYLVYHLCIPKHYFSVLSFKKKLFANGITPDIFCDLFFNIAVTFICLCIALVYFYDDVVFHHTPQFIYSVYYCYYWWIIELFPDLCLCVCVLPPQCCYEYSCTVSPGTHLGICGIYLGVLT